MNEIVLQQQNASGITYISNRFFDEYMPSANGEYVKVFLYLLRLVQAGTLTLSPAMLADVFDHTEKDILRAFIYWERMDLLELSYDDNKELIGLRILDLPTSPLPPSSPDGGSFNQSVTKRDATPNPATTTAVEPTGTTTGSNTQKTTSDASPAANVTNKKEYSRSQLEEFTDKEDVQELLFISERYIGRPLNTTEIQTIFYWYDSLQFSVDLIDYLIEYCVNRGHTSIHYMDKVALGWAEIDIRTVAQAKKTANLHSRANYTVIKALGIKGRNLVELETTMIQKWTETYAFSLDIVEEACTRTISATHQPSFEYTDSILTRWHQSGVKTMDDIKKLDETYQQNKKVHISKEKTATNNKFNNFVQRSYDYDQLEKKLLSRNQN